MTLRKIWKTSITAFRLTVVLAVIMALGFSGAMAAERAYVETSKAQAAAAERAKLLPQPAETASQQGSMAKGSGPCTEQAAMQAAPIGVNPDNDARHRG